VGSSHQQSTVVVLNRAALRPRDRRVARDPTRDMRHEGAFEVPTRVRIHAARRHVLLSELRATGRPPSTHVAASSKWQVAIRVFSGP
jgi:hypothetical protein